MSRNFENFVDAYFDYTKDGYVPDKFHFWCALSTVAAAMERKCWLPWAGKFMTYPNLYMLLIAQPGVGKSTALRFARELLQDIKEPPISIAPEQSTAASFIEILSKAQSFEGNGKIHLHSSTYLSFSEASNSALQNIYGDYVACLTDFYDCPAIWKKSTVGKGEMRLGNICVNMVAGCTFDYLSKLVTKDNIMGGFASRLFYIAQTERVERKAKFLGGEERKIETNKEDPYRVKLLEDLSQIHKMRGPFRAEDGFGEMWEDWFNKNDAERQALQSETMQSILARKNINTLKVCMLLSAAESPDRIIKIKHWERALELTDAIDATIVDTFSKSKAQNTKEQSGINALIFRQVQKQHTNVEELKRVLLLEGVNPNESEITVQKMLLNGVIKDVGGHLKLGVNPDNYL